MQIFAAKKSSLLLGVVLFAALAPAGGFAQDEGLARFFAASDDASPTQAEIRDLVQGRNPSDAVAAGSIDAELSAFYAARDFKPAWSGGDTTESNARNVTEALAHAGDQGLRSADYIGPLSRWKDAAPERGRDAALYDVTLTASFLRYAKDVYGGRFKPNDIFHDVSLPSRDLDGAVTLERALERDSIAQLLATLPPPQAGYRNLVDALAHYRAIAAKGGWPAIGAKDASSLGGSLMHRLALEDQTLADTPDPSGEDLKVAVLRFQRHHGLDDDGKIGPDMIRELNVSAAYRVQQIQANMERWRWVPRNFESRYIRVNVPDQSVDFVRNGKVVLHSKVIIGRKNSQTPILRTAVTGVVSNPPWDIPGDIADKQLLPHLRKDPNYLASRNMILADGPADDPRGTNIDWRSTGNIPYQVQQVPGPSNVLGVLMLDSPNAFDVYLHDTGNRKLFQEKTRELSNGCVRVDQIFALASLAFTNGSSDDADEITQAIASGQTQRLALDQAMPLYLLYWTALAQSGGDTEFRPDRYGRDRAMIAKFAPPTRKVSVARQG
jgi:murein L,D-transpeptidase YcbB/YkuD